MSDTLPQMAGRTKIFPNLVILKQNSLLVDTSERDGVMTDVHIVVKQSPFIISLVLEGGNLERQFTFKDFDLNVRLFYDSTENKVGWLFLFLLSTV